MSKHVLLALTSHDRLGRTGRTTGFYVPEAAHPCVTFARFGYEIDFVSPKGGLPPMEGDDRSDPVVAAFLDDPVLSDKLARTPVAVSLDAKDYDALLFVGGHGAMWDFPHDTDLLRLAAGVYENGGVIGAVCHGPAALVNLHLSDGKLLAQGRTVAGFSDEEEAKVGLADTVPFLLESKLREVGAEYTSGPPFTPHTAVDGRLVTGQNPQSAARVGELMVTALGGH